MKIILECRFQINSFASGIKIKTFQEVNLNGISSEYFWQHYKNEGVERKDFDIICKNFDHHTGLLALAYNNVDWLYQKKLNKAVWQSQSVTALLWELLESLIRKFHKTEILLLCAITLKNPILRDILERELGGLIEFKNKNIFESLYSLERKFFIQELSSNQYVLNTYLREVCYTFIRSSRTSEMKTIESIAYFNSLPKPVYNNIRQSQEKGDYSTFYKSIRDLRRQGDFIQVNEILNYVFENDPVINKVGVLSEIAITYKNQKRYKEAIDTLEKALNINNKDVKVYNELATIYKEQKRYDEAIKILEELIENYNHIPAYNELAIIYKEQKRYDEAIKILEELIENYDHIPAYNELAIIYKEQKRYNEAIKILEGALKISSKDAKTQNEMAMIYYEQGNYSKAVQILEELIEKYNHIPAYNVLARIYKEKGNTEKAIKIIQKGLVTLPNDIYLNRTLKNLKSLKQVSENFNKKPSESTKPKKNSDMSHKKKVLFVAANPSNEARIQTDVEHRTIKAEMMRGSHRDFFEFIPPQFAVTITELLRSMNTKPDIIHFAGHGAEEGIIISTETNDSQMLTDLVLQRLFKPLSSITKMVILNSCYSANQAEIISRFGMYVVGNKYSIGDNAAISFAKGLYNGLSEGKEIKEALNDALIVIMTESPDYSDVIEVWKDGKKIFI